MPRSYRGLLMQQFERLFIEDAEIVITSEIDNVLGHVSICETKWEMNCLKARESKAWLVNG